jgi:GTP pyrophosphokinase
MAETYKFSSLDDFYAAIGYGAISAQQVVMRLGVADDADEAVLPQVAPPAPARTGGVRVKGVGDCSCASPSAATHPGRLIPRLHHAQHHHAPAHLPDGHQRVATNRLIEVEWEGSPADLSIAIRIEAYDRTGLLSDISNVAPG